MSLVGSNDNEKLSDLGKKTYRAQAIWFLNAYFEKMTNIETVAEDVWTFVNKFSELDRRGKDGNELDEFGAHRFLESIGEVLSVKDMRQALRDIDLDFNKKVALIEYIVYKYRKDVNIKTLVNANQTANQEELNKATEFLEGAQRSLGVARDRAEVARKAEVEARSAEAENKRALAELHKEEESYFGKISSLETISNDSSLGIVKRNKARAECSQLQAEDPLPLRRAKINQGATVRKSERAANAAADARKEAENALNAADEAFRVAEAYLIEVKSKTGSSKGAIWFIERDLQEAKKYLPQRAGGVSKK